MFDNFLKVIDSHILHVRFGYNLCKSPKFADVFVASKSELFKVLDWYMSLYEVQRFLCWSSHFFVKTEHGLEVSFSLAKNKHNVFSTHTINFFIEEKYWFLYTVIYTLIEYVREYIAPPLFLRSVKSEEVNQLLTT